MDADTGLVLTPFMRGRQKVHHLRRTLRGREEGTKFNSLDAVQTEQENTELERKNLENRLTLLTVHWLKRPLIETSLQVVICKAVHTEDPET